MFLPEDDHHLRRAIWLAMQGRGRAEPNPLVGCVIANAGRIIGEGFHQQFGQAHAEPNALAACTQSPAGATAYVTLEPCCHLHKKTPPCVPRLIESKVVRVVVGCLDPNPAVNGQGVRMLREAGIAVDVGCMEAECRQLIAPFIARTVMQRPYVTLKWAQTADGAIAGAQGRPIRITNAAATRQVHRLRSRCDAIVVGIGTVLTDDPLLSARGVETLRQPMRVVLDRDGRTPPLSRLCQSQSAQSPVVIYRSASSATNSAPPNCTPGVQSVAVPLGADGELSLAGVLASLHAASCTHVLIEPGPTLARAFFAAGLADRLWVFRSPHRLDDSSAPRAANVPDSFVPVARLNFDGDELTEFLNRDSPFFFAAVASPDAILGTDTPG